MVKLKKKKVNGSVLVEEMEKLISPLPDMVLVGSSSDSDSFKKIDLNKEMELFLPPHCGSFAFKRKFHTHEGIDFYAPDGAKVGREKRNLMKKFFFYLGLCERRWCGELDWAVYWSRCWPTLVWLPFR